MGASDCDVVGQVCEEYAFNSSLPAGYDIDRVRGLLSLRHAHIVRPLRANATRWSKFRSDRVQSVCAVFLQLAGDEAKRPCHLCAQQKGMWPECIITSDRNMLRSSKGACANCHYNGFGSKCSFRNQRRGSLSEKETAALPPSMDLTRLSFSIPVEYRVLAQKPPGELSHYQSFQETELFKLHRQLFAIALLEHCPVKLDSVLSGLARAAPEYLDLVALEPPALESYKDILSAKRRQVLRDVAAAQLMEWHIPPDCEGAQEAASDSGSEISVDRVLHAIFQDVAQKILARALGGDIFLPSSPPFARAARRGSRSSAAGAFEMEKDVGELLPLALLIRHGEGRGA